MAKCVINGCTDLITCLNQAVQGPAGSQFIDLSAGLFDAAGQLAGYLGLTSLTVNQLDATTPLIQPGPPCVSIVGKAVLFPAGPSPQIEYQVTILGQVVNGDVELSLRGTPIGVASWTFGANFSSLPDYYGYNDAGLVWLPSFYNTMVVAQPEFRIETVAQPLGLSFSGLVDLTQQALQAIGEYFPNSTAVPLQGGIAIRAGTFPLFALTGSLGSSYTIKNLAALSLQFGTADAAGNEPAASTLLLVGTTDPSGPLPGIQLSAPVLQGNFSWVITGEPLDKSKWGLSGTLSKLLGFAGVNALPLPAGMGTNDFYLSSVTVAITPDVTPTLNMLGFGITSNPDNDPTSSGKSWQAPIPGLLVSDMFVEWQVINPFSSPEMMGTIGGTLRFGSGTTDPRLDIQVSLDGITTDTAPDVEITAELDPDYPVPIGALFRKLTGIDLGLKLELTQFLFIGETGSRTLQFSATLDGKWPFPVDFIVFGETVFFFRYTPNSITGSVSVHVTLASTFEFLVTAAYAGAGEGWEFSGQLAPASQGQNLQTLVNNLSSNYPDPLPANLGAITLEQFDISFNTKTEAFSFDGALSWPFKFDNYFDLTIDAAVSVQSPGPSPTGRKYAGYVSGKLSINAFSISVLYEFDIQQNTTLTFVIQYKQVSLTCAFSKNDKDERILTANLGGVTFGGILEYLVNLVDPNLGFSLSAPWDVLNQINFDNLTLTANLTTKEVGISYKAGLNLGIVDIDTIGLTYVNRAGRKTVDISITGSFFDQEYPKDNPLSWDLLNDPAPALPGKGDQLLDLRYLGIGQNVAFRSVKNFKNVQDVIAQMESDFLPAKTSGDSPANPLTFLDNLRFSPNGNWLVGADFTIMGAVSLSIVFNDPQLYGLRIALSGDKVKSLAGLDFQILYKKVTDTIGVYHIELTLPEAFRQFQMGAVSVTLPSITIDIYTNGNFRVDFGFPVGLDFSRSFCVQAGPFIGYGGFYFALLDGSTSDRVPRITNGTFSPVIEAGIALNVGVGRTIDKGILSAGVSVTVTAIVQGVLGWFNPNDRSAGTALYYWVQGTAAIVGKLYGTVNFVIIQAEVNVTAYASVTITIEAYKPILIQLSVGVEVSVSIKILFFRVSFSFSMTLDLSFTIGSASQTPWIEDASQPPSLSLRQQSPFLGRWRLSGARLQSRLLRFVGPGGTFDWTARQVFPTKQIIPLSLVPSLTVALPQTVFATHLLAGVAGQPPQLQIVAALFTENSISIQARRAADVRTIDRPDAETAPFNLLASGMLQWALSSYTRQVSLNVPPPAQFALASDLEAIEEYLANPALWQSAFTYHSLTGMMDLNYVLQISTPLGPSGMANSNETAATVFPMIPELSMTPGEGPSGIEFWNYGCVTPDYENALGDYYAQLRTVNASGPTGPGAQARQEARTQAGPVGCTGGESLSTFIFRDYFAMVAKGAVNAASGLLKAYPYEPTGSLGPTGWSGPAESLASIAQNFSGASFEYRTRQGDRLGTIAGRFGIPVSAVRLRNPHLTAFSMQERLPAGLLVVVEANVTPAAIAGANPGYPLHFMTPNPVFMTIDGVMHQVQGATGVTGGQSESIRQIAGSLYVDDATSIFTFLPPTIPPANPNADNTQLLQPRAQMAIPAQTFHAITPEDDISSLVAAFFFVRSIGPPKTTQTPWYTYQSFYEQWILANNLSLTGPTWAVPGVTMQNGALTVTGTEVYAPMGASGSLLAPDTPQLVGGYFAMQQLQPAPFTQAYQNFQQLVSASGPTGTYSIQAFDYKVQPGDTVGGIAELFGVPVIDLVNANLYSIGLLRTLAVLALPRINYPIHAGDTLASVAASFDLKLDDLADSVQNNDGILQQWNSGMPTLTIPDVPGRNTAQLVSDLVNFGRFNDVSGMVTRFLLHGMRVPKPGTPPPFTPATQLWGLYEMDGQQFPVPASVTGPSGQLDIVFRDGGSSSWICFENQGPSGPTGCTGQMTVHLAPDFFADPPSLSLEPEILAGPGPLPLYRETPPRYAMQQSIHWQSPSAVPLPGPTAQGPLTGQPSLWMFPAALQGIAASGPSGPTAPPQYELMIADPRDPSGASDVAVSHYCWASAIDVRVQLAPDAAGTPSLSNGYVLAGADQDGRDALLAAWIYMQSAVSGQLYILYPPSAASNNSQGLASDPADPSRTFLLKSNLTTVTKSNLFTAALALGESPSGDYYARLAAIPDFLRMAWEASVTGSGGFYLNYVNSNGGGGLPATIFASDAVATVTLLLVTGPQSSPWQPDRGLYPFNNCALVGDNIDPGSMSLYVRLTSPTASDLTRVSSVAAGNAGFYLARTNPDPGGTGPVVDPFDQTRLLYNLTGFRIGDNDFFNESNEGLPAGPADTPVAGVSGPTGSGVWWYQQVLPVYKFGKVNATPASPALPGPSANPYAGITLGPGPQGATALSQVEFDLAFHDVYGNQTSSSGPSGPVVAPVGYTDELIAISTWPSIGTDFEFLPGPSASITLDARLSMQIDRYIPSGPNGFDQSHAAGEADSTRYGQIFYQVQQPDLAFGIQTNLGTVSITTDALKAPMTAFVSKANVFTAAAASLQQRLRATIANDQLGLIANEYNVTLTALAEENADRNVQALFSPRIVHPAFAVAGPNNTLNLLVQNQSYMPYPTVCGPSDPECGGGLQAAGSVRLRSSAEPPVTAPARVTGSSPLSVTQLATNNQTVPLTPGVDLRTAARVSPVPGDTLKETLATVAKALQCVVYAVVPDSTQPPGTTIEIGLFPSNLAAPNVVAPNLDIEIEGMKVNTGLNPTFQSVQQAFAPLKLDTGDFVVRLAAIPGIFAAKARVTIADFIVPQPVPNNSGQAVPAFSLASMPAGTGDINFLATHNSLVQNFFFTGSPIYLQYCCYTPTPFDTIASLAAQFGITVGQLATFNSAAPLNGGIELRIPNLVYLDRSQTVYAPYSPLAKDSLDTIAQNINATTTVLATLNANLPGIFSDNVGITIGTTTLNALPLDSLQSMATRFSLPFGQFVAAIAAKPGLFRANGVIITPLPVVPNSPAIGSASWNQTAGKFNTQTAAMLSGNRCLEGFLQKDAMIAGPTGPTPTKPIQVGAHDTVDSIIREFLNDQQTVVTVDQLVALNGNTTGLLTTGTPFLLSPNPTGIDTTLTPQIPPGATGCESAIVFPVTVSATMRRSQALVAPDFQNSPAVFSSTSRVQPRGAQNGDALALTEFAKSFESAFSAFDLKCAVANRTSLSDPKNPGELMAVNFGDSGVSQFEVRAGTPQFYALAPLATSLQSGQLLVPTYKSGCGLCPPTLKTFDSVDLDGWMQTFLSAIDLVLSTPYALPAFQQDIQQSAMQAPGPVGLSGIAAAWGATPGFGQIEAPGCSGCTGGTGTYGPGNFDDIVASKLRIAGALRNDVVPILDVAGPSGGYYQDVARDSLYQQMLVRLSDAYSVNAIVQYPVAIESPCVTPVGSSGPVAPRVSGTVIPDLYTIPDDAGKGANSLNNVSTYFGVSTPYLAETAGDVRGILATGASVSYGQNPIYVIGAQDTINTVARVFGVPTDPDASGYWEKWTAFAEGVGAEPILLAGAGVPVVKVTRQVFPGNTLGDIASYLGIDAGAVGEANQSTPGLFAAKQPIDITGYQPYTVGVGDTLSHIASTIVPDTGSDPMTVEKLARAVANQQNLLVSGSVWYMSQILPDVTTSTTKVSLGPVGRQGGLDPALSFLFTVKHPRQFKSLFLNLKYVINELEFNIETVPNTGGYQSSSWLTFLLPIGSGQGSDAGVETAMEQVQIPIPLRAYPIPPTVQAQSGLPTPQTTPPLTPADAIAQGKRWDYRMDFEGQSAAQDTDYVQVVFNVAPTQPRAMLTRTDLVFFALAEFMTAWPELSADLAILPTLQPGAYSRTAAVAVQVLDTLAAGVAQALEMSLTPQLAASQWPEIKYLYRLQTTSSAGELAELALGMQYGPTGAGPIWPDVFIKSLTGLTGPSGPDAGFLQLTGQTPFGITADFVYPPGFPVDQPITQRFLFRERDVIQNQNASGGIYVTRNDDLISSGPLGAGVTGPIGNIATNQAFIYQTPLVSFIDPLTPLVTDGSAIDIAGLTGPSGPPSGAKTLADHIVNMLDAVLELGPNSPFLANSEISILCSYGFAVSGAGTPGEIVAQTPVRLVATQQITPDQKIDFATQLANSIAYWPGWWTSSADGVLIFDFTAYSVPPGMTGPESPKPILEFSNLRVPLSSISGWPGKQE